MYLQIFVFLALSIVENTISSNPFSEIVGKIGSRKCYHCENDCSSPVPVTCPTTGKCFSKSLRNPTGRVQQKGCLESYDPTFCNAENNELQSCYICEGDFCNSDSGNSDLGVSECYFCDEKCEDPPSKQNCQEFLTATEGADIKAACLSYEINQVNDSRVYKGCIPDAEDLKEACMMQNIVFEDIKCAICETDLCNYNEEEESFVDECYFCEGTCEVLQVQNCRETLGEDSKSKCLAAEYIDENGHNILRTCTEVTQIVENSCTLINSQGGNCTICDTNLCNGKNDEVVEEDYVEKCYYCDKVCVEPLEIHNCAEVLEENSKSRCIVSEYSQDGSLYTSRGCIQLNANVLTVCEAVNEEGGNCTICDTNLCNGLNRISSADMINSSILTIFAIILSIIYNLCRMY